jgi:hypothetical protein
MSYPTTIPAFRDALQAYVPAEPNADSIEIAQMERSTVAKAVRVFETLKADTELDNDGLALLLGAAHLIASNDWYALAGDAVTVVAQRAAEYVPPEPAPSPIKETI